MELGARLRICIIVKEGLLHHDSRRCHLCRDVLVEQSSEVSCWVAGCPLRWAQRCHHGSRHAPSAPSWAATLTAAPPPSQPPPRLSSCALRRPSPGSLLTQQRARRVSLAWVPACPREHLLGAAQPQLYYGQQAWGTGHRKILHRGQRAAVLEVGWFPGCRCLRQASQCRAVCQSLKHMKTYGGSPSRRPGSTELMCSCLRMPDFGPKR